MSHPRTHAMTIADKLAAIMSDGSDALTYGELEEVANRGAHLLRSFGLQRGDVVAYWLPNTTVVFEIYWAAQRCGLYITPIQSSLTGDEAQYVVENSRAKLVIVAPDIAGAATFSPAEARVMDLGEWAALSSKQPSYPIADESPGYHMVYSSGTTGRPKGVRLPLPEGDVAQPHQVAETLSNFYGIGAQSIYLSPAPLYHTAPLAYTTSSHRLGATVVVMPKFDAHAWLEAVQRYKVTVTQMVPTMFVRLLKLRQAERVQYDLSSLETVIHAAAPCPVPIKREMIEWLGPIIEEYYGGSEGNGSTRISSAEWLEKPGSVGRAAWGTLHICDDTGEEVPVGQQGLVYFEGGWDFQYLGDEKKTRESRNAQHGSWSTLGDIGYVDEDGYLFLTDRKSYMIISGGVNIYPQEVENLLITHPRVGDAAVIGVPNSEFGEEVKAVVQPLDAADATPTFGEELIAFCRQHLAAHKCPRSVDFDAALPRLDNGKLYKRLVRDRYWQGHEKRIAG